MRSRRSFRKALGTAISLLLAICLPPGQTKHPGAMGLGEPGIPRQTVFFAPPSDAGAGSVLSAGRRTYSPSCDGPLQSAWIAGRTLLVRAGGSLSFPTEDEARFAHRADRAATPIRAPPCLHPWDRDVPVKVRRT